MAWGSKTARNSSGPRRQTRDRRGKRELQAATQHGKGGRNRAAIADSIRTNRP